MSPADAPPQGPSCALCGGATFDPQPDPTRLVRAPAGHRVERCHGCGLVALRPPFTSEEKAAIYGPHYYDAYTATTGMAGGDTGIAPHLVERLNAAERRLGGKGPVLDVGCAAGHFLAHAEAAGWEAWGIEASPAADQAAARLPAGRIFRGPVEDAPFPAGRFRFVHLNHVLEHLDDPVAALRRVAAWLAPGGIAVLEVPNEFHTLFYWVGRLLLPLARRAYAVPTSHQFFFTPATLRRTAETAGLRVESVATVRRAFGLQDRFAPMRWAKRLLYLAEKPLGMAGMIELRAGGR